MAFKSEAQRRKFKELLDDKKISQEVYDGFSENTPEKLPGRVKQKEKKKRGKPNKVWEAKVIK